jgi:hypothetical protein
MAPKEFARQVLATCDDDRFDAVAMLFKVGPSQETLDVYAVLHLPSPDELREELKGRHDLLCLASKTTWAPREHEEPKPAWVAVIVGRRIAPLYLAKIIGVEDGWTLIPPEEIPGWALATTRSLSRCLEGEPFTGLRMSADGGRQLNRIKP